jgi:hypothetical protein
MTVNPQPTPPADPSDRQAACSFLATVLKPRAVAFAVRCAERVAPLVLDDHPDAVERLNAVAAVLRVLAAWVRGVEVSRFTLRLVRDIAYDVADVCDSAGPILYAAAAVLDADPSRSVASAMREAMRLGADEVRLLVEQDFARLGSADQPFGPLWPAGEPDWARIAWAKLAAERPRLSRLVELPASDRGG